MKLRKMTHVTMTIRPHVNQKIQFSAPVKDFEGSMAEKSPILNLRVQAHSPICRPTALYSVPSVESTLVSNVAVTTSVSTPSMI